ncbi:hypothetical protein EJB05_10665, partial [Eragrostis curvula]
MELGGAPNSGVVNMTRTIEALSPMLNNPRKTIARVEVLVSVAAALLLLQFILSFCRRLWHNSFVSFVLKVCNKAMFPFIVYILGTMQTSPIKNSVYPIWALSLIMASGATAYRCRDAIRPPYYRKFIFSKLIEGGIGVLVFGFSYSAGHALWMKKYANSDCDPNSMSDYNYPDRRPISIVKVCRSFFTDEIPSNDNVTTVDQIWDIFGNSDDGIPADDNKNRVKDVCLSFALFELLKRRKTIGQASFISELSISSPLNKMRIPAEKVSDAEKKAVVISLISADGELTKGERTLRKHEMFVEYSWTMKDFF